MLEFLSVKLAMKLGFAIERMVECHRIDGRVGQLVSLQLKHCMSACEIEARSPPDKLTPDTEPDHRYVHRYGCRLHRADEKTDARLGRSTWIDSKETLNFQPVVMAELENISIACPRVWRRGSNI
jgi:hypothetical protein